MSICLALVSHNNIKYKSDFKQAPNQLIDGFNIHVSTRQLLLLDFYFLSQSKYHKTKQLSHLKDMNYQAYIIKSTMVTDKTNHMIKILCHMTS